jgi:hypothetical protein
MVVIDMLKGRLSATSQNLCGALSPASAGFSGKLSAGYLLQEKIVVPGAEEQIITADVGFGGLSSVTISPIPQNYGLITYDGSTITVS